MNSNITVGFMDGRSRSRILKPPGGGYSEIFFEQPSPKINETKTAKTVIETATTAATTKNLVEVKNEKKVEEKKEECKLEKKIEDLKIEEEPVVEAIKESNDDSKQKIVEEAKVVVEPKIVEQPRRTRVPPGGFSSGLW